ncbi:MAG TPA: hypothetical protein VMQ11_10640 [Alphaproteobacteria bacterium]|nr:hypothetical protein [Alphaproteobacteria bacterium]
MTVSTRHFLFQGDEIRPLTQNVLERLRRGEVRLPAYAGQDLRVVDVSIEVKERRPVKVRRITAAVLSLDETGALRSRLLEDLRASLSASRRGRTPARQRWAPSQAQLDRVTELALARRRPKLKPPRATALAAARGGKSRVARRVDGKGRGVV